jgi:hypothetical protein
MGVGKINIRPPRQKLIIRCFANYSTTNLRA